MNGNGQLSKGQLWWEGGGEIIGDTVIDPASPLTPQPPTCFAKTKGDQGQHREEAPPLRSLLCPPPHQTVPRASSGLPRPQCWPLMHRVTLAWCSLSPHRSLTSRGETLLQNSVWNTAYEHRHCVCGSPALFSPHLAQGSIITKWRNEYRSLWGFRVIIIIHLFSDPLYVPKHGQGTGDTKMNCPWLVPSRSVWLGEGISQDVVGRGMQWCALRQRNPEGPLAQPGDMGTGEVRVQVLSRCLRTTRVIWVKSGEGAACRDLEVRENVANSGNLMCLSSVGESSGREEWDRQGWRGGRDQVLQGLECQAGKLSLSSGRWETWKGTSRGGA